MDESRKDFEQWALEVMQFTPDDLRWDESRNCYRDYVPHIAWKGWQAGRLAGRQSKLKFRQHVLTTNISMMESFNQ